MYEGVIKAANKIVQDQIEDEKVRRMFKNCFGDMLRNSIQELEDGSTFVLTGDIPAMWLRDSTCQLRPFIIFAGQFADLDSLIERIINKQISLILKDPYANAFNMEASGKRWDDDIPLQKAETWEQKYEIDSLCFPFQLAYQYWKYTGRKKISIIHLKGQWKQLSLYGKRNKIMKVNLITVFRDQIQNTCPIMD